MSDISRNDPPNDAPRRRGLIHVAAGESREPLRLVIVWSALAIFGVLLVALVTPGLLGGPPASSPLAAGADGVPVAATVAPTAPFYQRGLLLPNSPLSTGAPSFPVSRTLGTNVAAHGTGGRIPAWQLNGPP
ncbi:MAG: hypothetical protein ABI890_06560, partial [Lapillicoccus sp.]